ALGGWSILRVLLRRSLLLRRLLLRRLVEALLLRRLRARKTQRDQLADIEGLNLIVDLHLDFARGATEISPVNDLSASQHKGIGKTRAGKSKSHQNIGETHTCSSIRPYYNTTHK